MAALAGPRLHAPATGRNRQPILDVLFAELPPDGTVLEIASGTGEHAVFLAPRLAPRFWLPSDADPKARASIDAWRAEQPCERLLAPLALDVCWSRWPVEAPGPGDTDGAVPLLTEPVRAIVCINMIHISPWQSCLGLLAGARRVLPPGGVLYLYGPFKRDGRHTAPSNETFDHSLKASNWEWGVRDLAAVAGAAKAQGLALERVVEMPANNLSVIFRI